MGNCHFKSEFETENVTGNYFLSIYTNLINNHYSFDKVKLQLLVLHRKRRFW